MTQSIYKNTLVSKIGTLMPNGKLKCQQSQENNDQANYVAWTEQIAICEKILSRINTFEQKFTNVMSKYRIL